MSGKPGPDRGMVPLEDENMAKKHTAESDPCPHGIPHEQRKRDGCEDCDLASYNEFRAKQDAAKFRVRVIQTARAVLPQMVKPSGDLALDGSPVFRPERTVRWAFQAAEAFEHAADEYLKGGGK